MYALEDNYNNKKIDTKVYNAGIYLRLSREDENMGQSESIVNQKEFLTSYVIEQGWNLTDIYIDDGYTGTNFNRPDFKRMIKDIEAKKINLVITKDMSRLGRDYIDTGYYIERYFPERNIRYIAVNDGIDTFATNNSNNDMSPFKSVMNDMYAKDISKKVRTAFNTKKKNGQFIGAFAPYGYQKDLNNKNKLVIDEMAAPVIKRIFDMYVNEHSMRNISCVLDEESILSPSAYKKQNSNYNGGKPKNKLWYPEIIKLILTNPTYAGNMAQNKCTVISYKVKKLKSIPKESWIIVENTHEPIVCKETFDLVQQLIDRKVNTHNNEVKNTHILSGLIYCKDCGARMTFLNNSNKKQIIYAVCSNYKRFKGCTRHGINEHKLNNLVLGELRKLSDNLNHKEVAESLEGISQNTALEQLQKEIYLAENRLSEIKKAIKSLYEDKLKGILFETDFIGLTQDFNKEREKLLIQIDRLNKEKQKYQERESENLDLIELVKDFIKFNKVDRITLLQLIDKIVISNDKKIDIYYKFKNPFSEPNQINTSK